MPVLLETRASQIDYLALAYGTDKRTWSQFDDATLTLAWLTALSYWN